MTEYAVAISEEFVHRLVVEASSKEEAVEKAYQLVAMVDDDVLKEENDYELEAVGFMTDGYDVEEVT